MKKNKIRPMRNENANRKMNYILLYIFPIAIIILSIILVAAILI